MYKKLYLLIDSLIYLYKDNKKYKKVLKKDETIEKIAEQIITETKVNFEKEFIIKLIKDRLNFLKV